MFYIKLENENKVLLPAIFIIKKDYRRLLVSQYSKYCDFSFWLIFDQIECFLYDKEKLEFNQLDKKNLATSVFYNIKIPFTVLLSLSDLHPNKVTWEDFNLTCFGEPSLQNEMKLANARQILGLQENASEDKIKLVFRKLSMIYHPDIEETGNIEHFRRVSEAYQLLLNNK